MDVIAERPAVPTAHTVDQREHAIHTIVPDIRRDGSIVRQVPPDVGVSPRIQEDSSAAEVPTLDRILEGGVQRLVSP